MLHSDELQPPSRTFSRNEGIEWFKNGDDGRRAFQERGSKVRFDARLLSNTTKKYKLTDLRRPIDGLVNLSSLLFFYRGVDDLHLPAFLKSSHISQEGSLTHIFKRRKHLELVHSMLHSSHEHKESRFSPSCENAISLLDKRRELWL